MPGHQDGSEVDGPRPLSNAGLIRRAAESLNPQMLDGGSWVADVGAAVEAVDGQVFTGASIGGFLSVCAELGALSQLVATTMPTVNRMVAVWRDPADGVLHVIPPCGRCRELVRTMATENLAATVILGPDHTASLRELLPYAAWYAEPVSSPGPGQHTAATRPS